MMHAVAGERSWVIVSSFRRSWNGQLEAVLWRRQPTSFSLYRSPNSTHEHPQGWDFDCNARRFSNTWQEIKICACKPKQDSAILPIQRKMNQSLGNKSIPLEQGYGHRPS
jgi:hypothetical protein